MRKGWIDTTIGELAQINPESLGVRTPTDYEFGYIDLSMVNEGKITYPIENIRYNEASPRARRKLTKGDILLSTVRPNLKGFGRIDKNAEDLICSTGFAVLRCQEKETAEYLYQYIFSDFIYRQIDALVVGSNYPAINNDDVQNLEITIPASLVERSKIAAILSTWDDAIEKLEQMYTKKLKLWRIQRSKSLSQLGEKFGVTTIDEMTKAIVGGGTPSRQNESYWNGDIPWVSVKDLIAPVLSDTQEHISKTALRESASNLIPAFTPIISTRMAVGRTAYFTVDVAINQDLKALVPSDECNPRYLFHCMRALEGKIFSLGTGSTVSGVTLDVIREQVIPKADKKSQEIFIAFADSSERQLNMIQTQIDVIKSQKRGLMQKLLTGEWRVNASGDAEAA